MPTGYFQIGQATFASMTGNANIGLHYSNVLGKSHEIVDMISHC